MLLEERGRLMVERQKLASRLGDLERELKAAKPHQAVGIQIGIDALRKTIAEVTHRIGELGGK